MRVWLRYGLLCGAGGILLDLALTPWMAFCTPLVSLSAGGLAGYLAARRADLPTQGMGARLGARAGGFAGVLILGGQLLASLLVYFIYQPGGFSNPLVYTPVPGDPFWLQAFYFSAGFGLVVAFSATGALLALMAGAALGYFASPGADFGN